jgi:enamine deaminase RidA (YjgF/YER057c/UK114 family)
MMVQFTRRLEALGLSLPVPPSPRGSYAGVIVHDGIAYVSGQVSRVGDETIMGPVDDRTPPDVIRAAAQACVLRALSTLGTVEGEGTVARILFLRGFINVVPGFKGHSAVLDEASALLLAIFGDAGRHARSAIGVASLPSGGLLEIELVVALARVETPLTEDPS